MPRSRSEDDRVRYGRVVWAFIRAGWNPPRPSDRIAHALLDDIERVQPQAKLALSPVEQHVLELLAEGHTYAEIERRLNMSHERFRDRQRNLYRRLGVKNSAGAVAEGFRLGLLS